MRQITFFQFEVGTCEMADRGDNMFEKVSTPVAVVEETSMDKGKARKAIRDAGVDCKRGTDVYFKKVGKVLYKFETEDLLKIVKEREELPL